MNQPKRPRTLGRRRVVLNNGSAIRPSKCRIVVIHCWDDKGFLKHTLRAVWVVNIAGAETALSASADHDQAVGQDAKTALKKCRRHLAKLHDLGVDPDRHETGSILFEVKV